MAISESASNQQLLTDDPHEITSDDVHVHVPSAAVEFHVIQVDHNDEVDHHDHDSSPATVILMNYNASSATDHPPPPPPSPLSPPDVESESNENTPQTVQEPEISLKISAIAKICLLASVEGLIASLGIRFSASKLLTDNHRVLLTSGQICSVIGFLCCCGAYITETVHRRATLAARLMAAVGAVTAVRAFVLLGTAF